MFNAFTFRAQILPVHQPVLHRPPRASRVNRGWALDDVFVERLWRSVKYEDVYLKEYPSRDSKPRETTLSKRHDDPR